MNLAINAAIAYLTFRGARTVPLWGQQSIAGDTIGTTFFLPLITCLIVTPLVGRQVRTGQVPLFRGKSPGFNWAPRRTLWRGVLLGLISTLVVAPVALIILATCGVAHQGFWSFVLFKAAFAAALGVLVTPLIALWAITEPDAAAVTVEARG
ncbi:MAG TPA: hypothetical protein VMW17_03080 [Candidatus Binatia bacterium]|nr:hypothetical protein [Candidatus Binatia bacterium]